MAGKGFVPIVDSSILTYSILESLWKSQVKAGISRCHEMLRWCFECLEPQWISFMTTLHQLTYGNWFTIVAWVEKKSKIWWHSRSNNDFKVLQESRCQLWRKVLVTWWLIPPNLLIKLDVSALNHFKCLWCTSRYLKDFTKTCIGL